VGHLVIQTNKPKQTQFNPIQTQTKPIKANNQSSLITNHLEGKPNFFKGQKRCGTLEFLGKTEYDDNDTIR